MKHRLGREGIETGFEGEERKEELEESEEEANAAQDGIDDMFEGARPA